MWFPRIEALSLVCWSLVLQELWSLAELWTWWARSHEMDESHGVPVVQCFVLRYHDERLPFFEVHAARDACSLWRWHIAVHCALCSQHARVKSVTAAKAHECCSGTSHRSEKLITTSLCFLPPWPCQGVLILWIGDFMVVLLCFTIFFRCMGLRWQRLALELSSTWWRRLQKQKMPRVRRHGGHFSCKWKEVAFLGRKVLNASAPQFFDVVPAGRILNRFSKAAGMWRVISWLLNQQSCLTEIVLQHGSRSHEDIRRLIIWKLHENQWMRTWLIT